MKFIQIRDGIAIRKTDIVSVERLSEGGSRIWTLNTSYDCPFLYDSILQLLEIDGIEEKIKAEPQDNLWGTQHWVG